MMPPRKRKNLSQSRTAVAVGVWAGGVLPTHTGPDVSANSSWERALVRLALPGRALGSLGLGRHQRIFLACADRGFHCSAGQTQEGLEGKQQDVLTLGPRNGSTL